MTVRGFLLASVVLALIVLSPVSAQPAEVTEDASGFLLVTPTSGAKVYESQPRIEVAFNATLQKDSVTMAVDGFDVTDLEPYALVNETGMVYTPPELFALGLGVHNITVKGLGEAGNEFVSRWSFQIVPPPPKMGMSAEQVLVISLIGFAAAVVVGAVLLTYAMVWRDFRFRRFFFRHPIQRKLAPFYASIALATLATLLILLWFESLKGVPRFAMEFLSITAMVLAFGPYALDVQRQKRLRRAYERAYAQFLFELADALRGGIDPLKSLQELAKTETGVLGAHLRVAADGLRMGRPFEVVMRNIAQHTGSHLVKRYAALVGEAAKVGGEIASVVHRAAKDMDELVKINEDRMRQLTTPMMTMYIAFAVLLWMIKSLMDFAPDLASTDFGSLNDLKGTAAAAAKPRLSLETLQLRFFHLTLITSLGTGLLIGSFTEGKLRYGILHAFVMVGTAALFFRFVAL